MDLKTHLISLYGKGVIEPFVELDRPTDNFIINNSVPWQTVSRRYINDLMYDELSSHPTEIFKELSDEAISCIRVNIEGIQNDFMSDLDYQTKQCIIEKLVYDKLDSIVTLQDGTALSLFLNNFTYEIYSLMVDYKLDNLDEQLALIYTDFDKMVNKHINDSVTLYAIFSIYHKRINSLAKEDV